MTRFVLPLAALLASTATAALAQQPAPPPDTPLQPLPSPDLSEGASASAYLQAAIGALATGRTGETQEALEMAQTRLLDRSVPLGQTNTPSANPAVAQISAALQALAAGNRSACMTQIQAAQATLRANRG